MIRRLRIATVSCVLLFISSCGQTAPVSPASDAPQGLEARVETLERSITELQTDALLARLAEIAELDLEDGAYTTISTQMGVLLVRVDNVQRHLDGVRIALQVGNPYSVTFNGFKMSATWGPRRPELGSQNYAAENETWLGRLQTRELTLIETLRPASWNRVVITLSPADPATLGYLRIERPEFDNIGLARSPHRPG